MAKVAVDVHDVLAAYVYPLIKDLGWPKTWHGGLRQMWPWHDWDKHFELEHHAGFLMSLPAVSGFEAIHDIPAEVLIVTAATRYSELMAVLEWLRARDILYPLYRVKWVDRGRWCAENGVDALVDDAHPALISAYRAGVTPIAFHAPWNAPLAIEHRAYGWDEVPRMVRRVC